jgi:hypothetical protein
LKRGLKGIHCPADFRRGFHSDEVIDMPGAGISLVVLAVGAILDFAVTASPDQHGFDINRVGLILVIVGAFGLVLSVLLLMSGRGWYGARRHVSVMDDGRGNSVSREDVYR